MSGVRVRSRSGAMMAGLRLPVQVSAKCELVRDQGCLHNGGTRACLNCFQICCGVDEANACILICSACQVSGSKNREGAQISGERYCFVPGLQDLTTNQSQQEDAPYPSPIGHIDSFVF